MKNFDTTLYFITDSTQYDEAEFLRRVEEGLKGGATMLQLRETVEQALEAYHQGADYCGVGAIYPTTTKVKTVLTSTDTLSQICQSVPIPVNAIGGLNKTNTDVLMGIKIAGICVVSAIMKADDPKKEAETLLEISRKIKASC